MVLPSVFFTIRRRLSLLRFAHAGLLPGATSGRETKTDRVNRIV
jgi:hypothetical protein